MITILTYVTDLTDVGVRSERLEDSNDRGGEYSSISVIKYSGAWASIIETKPSVSLSHRKQKWINLGIILTPT